MGQGRWGEGCGGGARGEAGRWPGGRGALSPLLWPLQDCHQMSKYWVQPQHLLQLAEVDVAVVLHEPPLQDGPTQLMEGQTPLAEVTEEFGEAKVLTEVLDVLDSVMLL